MGFSPAPVDTGPLSRRAPNRAGVGLALPAVLFDGMPFGRGVIKQYVLVANTNTSLSHPLYRVPTLIVPLDNGTAFLPRWKRTATAWTTTTINIQVDTACAAPGCFFLVI